MLHLRKKRIDLSDFQDTRDTIRDDQSTFLAKGRLYVVIATITRDCSRRTNFGRKLKGKDYQKILGKIKGRDPELLNFFGQKLRDWTIKIFWEKLRDRTIKNFRKNKGHIVDKTNQILKKIRDRYQSSKSQCPLFDELF